LRSFQLPPVLVAQPADVAAAGLPAAALAAARRARVTRRLLWARRIAALRVLLTELLELAARVVEPIAQIPGPRELLRQLARIVGRTGRTPQLVGKVVARARHPPLQP